MPTYEYTCKTCGDRIEAVQSFHDKPLKSHAGCGGPLQRVFHASGVVFKGSGYYVTDSRSNGRGSSGDSTSSDADSNGSSSKKDTSESTSSTTSSDSSSKTSASGSKDKTEKSSD